ncbi:tetratricopeptide (TPR) repeat protein [Catalinimonas alkaloidigena]|uniref:tetratricopeptide repeat protein n=1 Tax=Catalinimonas alkaloidigena TaxID=1075417 RepID=UPI0024074239|nr:tetratricopeptide repeat protein [Catalinimonas alkaloidigena]MDF9796167.1 tetratricopeptide (TPR) repeat protein [Catalinimonas alkaloidigena]
MDDQAIQLAEKIDRYLQGKMTEDEQKSFEYQLAQDANLRENVENTDIAREAVLQRGLRMEIKQIRERILQEDDEERPPSESIIPESDEPKGRAETKIRKLSFLQYSYRVAAGFSLLLVAFVAVQMVMVSSEDLYADNIALSDLSEVTRGGGETASQTALLDAYQQNNFSQATEIFRNLETPTSLELYFAAASYLQLNQYDEAINIYQKVLANNQLDNDNDFLKQESSYKLALTYIRTGEYNQALPILKDLDENYPYYDNLISSSFMLKLKLLQFKESLFN